MACLLSDGIYELAELTAITEITGAGFVGVANRSYSPELVAVT
jgi:hypothetical protein